MASRDDIIIEITPQVLLKAYTCGIFPMAESADDPALYWIEPQQRGILELDKVHVPKRLARTIRQGVFDVRIDSDFEGVIDGCAASLPCHARGAAPVGLMVCGPAMSDRRILAVAAAIEKVLAGN